MFGESTLKIGPRTFYGGSTTPATRRFRLQQVAEKILSKPVHKVVPTLSSVVFAEAKRKVRPANRRSRAKLPEEPEILTLSSDDEDKVEDQPDIETEILANGFSPGVESQAVEGEEHDSAEERRKHPEGVEGGGMMEQAMDGSIKPPHVMMTCRTVRIGSYKVKPIDKVVITTSGIEFQVPVPDSDAEPVTISVPMSVMKRALVSFCRAMPVLFLYLKPCAGAEIRYRLKMTDPKSTCYYDPEATDQTQKRITMLPEKMNDDTKLIIKSIFCRCNVVMTEIVNKLANDILVRSSPRENHKLKSVHNGEIQTIMVYPPPPAKGGISINTEDYACLGEDQFLNDVIIDFYLKYLMQCVLSDEDKERTHVFSSFFYKRLTSRPKTKGRRSHPIEDDPKLTPAEKRHARVKGWTKHVNLFSKDFIIIPINENCHWFLAIVCYPGQNGCLRMSDNMPVDPPSVLPGSSSSVSAVHAAAAAAVASTSSKLKVKDNVLSIGSTTITPVKAAQPATITLDCNTGDDGSDRDEAEGDEEEMDDPLSDEEDTGNGPTETNGTKGNTVKEEALPTPVSATPNRTRRAGQQEAIKQPCILIFDSLMGAPRYKVVATLREYLRIEYKVKEGAEREKLKDFSKDTIKGMLPKVPQQNNFTDCGLYLLQYVESFFKNPIQDYRAPIKTLKEWFSEAEVTRKRQDIVQLIHKLMEEQKINPSGINLPVLSFSNNADQSQNCVEDAEAAARLAEADAEADALQSPSNLSGVCKQDAVEHSVPESAVEEVISAQVEIEPTSVMVICTGIDDKSATSNRATQVTAECSDNTDGEEDSNVNADETSEKDYENETNLQRPLVDYSESSSEGFPERTETVAGKRSQSGVEADNMINRKKRKGLNDR